jgi:hypothetical protein
LQFRKFTGVFGHCTLELFSFLIDVSGSLLQLYFELLLFHQTAREIGFELDRALCVMLDKFLGLFPSIIAVFAVVSEQAPDTSSKARKVN